MAACVCVLSSTHTHTHTHTHTGHGFMNATDWGKEMQKKLGRPDVQESEVQAAMTRIKDFLEKHLA
jgi:hypothetical protein